jgi:hypothetical protein
MLKYRICEIYFCCHCYWLAWCNFRMQYPQLLQFHLTLCPSWIWSNLFLHELLSLYSLFSFSFYISRLVFPVWCSWINTTTFFNSWQFLSVIFLFVYKQFKVLHSNWGGIVSVFEGEIYYLCFLNLVVEFTHGFIW